MLLLTPLSSVVGDDAWMGTVRTATDAGGNGSATSSIAAVSSSYYTVDAESAEAPDQYVLRLAKFISAVAAAIPLDRTVNCVHSALSPMNFCSVIYQGRVTHHLLKREAFGACFSINKMGTEARSLRDVIQFLGLLMLGTQYRDGLALHQTRLLLACVHSARPSGPWPVELKEPVPPLEDALELQLEGRMLLSKGDYPEALHVRASRNSSRRCDLQSQAWCSMSRSFSLGLQQIAGILGSHGHAVCAQRHADRPRKGSGLRPALLHIFCQGRFCAGGGRRCARVGARARSVKCFRLCAFDRRVPSQHFQSCLPTCRMV